MSGVRWQMMRAKPIACALALGAIVGAGIAPAPARADVAVAVASLPASEWNAIRRVIADQRKAFRAGDGPRAFSFASPGIRWQFGTHENFMAMVHYAYEALIDARYTEFLEGAVIEGAVVQPLRLVAADNSVLVALYTMEKQKDGQWKIAGCVLAPSTVRAT
jgi:hypothetical protein